MWTSGRRIGLTIEDEFWGALKEISAMEGRSIAAQIAEIDHNRGDSNLSSAIRTYVLAHYRKRSGDAGTNS